MVSLTPITRERPTLALAYAWAGVGIMWIFWVSFVIFLAEPRQIMAWWPLPTVDRTEGLLHPTIAAVIDLALVTLFGLQHSTMARPWFKQQIMARMPEPLQRVTYVHMANAVLFLLILVWQPIPIEVWNFNDTLARDALWLLFAAGWVILFLGACLSACASCSASSRSWPGAKAVASHRVSRLAFCTGGCATRCMWVCSLACGPRRA